MHAVPTTCVTARLVPSGDQSASCTSSKIFRGESPVMGTTARVPEGSKPQRHLRFSRIAISPEREIDRMSESGRLKRLDSLLPSRVQKSRDGSPFQDAP